MASADEKRGRDLAELARQFLLWLRDNELPGVEGFRYATIDEFNLCAGTYHRIEASSSRALDNRILPNLWVGEPKELKRLQSLRLGISFVLLVNNPHDVVELPDGRKFPRNQIVSAPNIPLEQPGALIV